jgi:hypothetical protein
MIPSHLFHKSCETKCFSAEASNLTGYWRGGPITIVSDLGHTATFECAETTYDDEGDIQCWVFKPTQESLDKIPQLKGWYVTVFND